MPFDNEVNEVLDRTGNQTARMEALARNGVMGDRSTQQKKKPNPAVQNPLGGDMAEGIVDPTKPMDFPGGQFY